MVISVLVVYDRLEGDHQTLTFGFIQLFNTIKCGGAAATSITTYFSLRHLEKFSQELKFLKILFASIARPLIRALGTKNTYASVSTLEKRPIKISELRKSFPRVKILTFLFCFDCKAKHLIRALGTKNTYASVSVMKKRPLKVSKHLWAPGAAGWDGAYVCMHFSQSKMHVYLIYQKIS